MTETELVANAHALTQIFGYWPSFHDAEVLTMCFDRAGEDGPPARLSDSPAAELGR
jgi:hypothetical protein